MKIENIRLNREIREANEQLQRANRELEERVEKKSCEAIHNLGVLRVSQEMLEVMPVVAIGVDKDGLIAVANQMAHIFFSMDVARPSLLGEAADTIIPAELLAWALPGLHQRHEDAQLFTVAGHEVRCWCRSLGELSGSRGVLLVMDAGAQIEVPQTGRQYRRHGDVRNQ